MPRLETLQPAPVLPRAAGGGVIRALQWLLMAAVVAAFVHYGFAGLKVARSRRTLGYGEFNSADRFFLEALHVDRGAEKLLEAISGLPPQGAIAIVAPRDNVYGPLLFQVIGAITWPHPIYLVPAGDEELDRTLGVLKEHHFAGALLYGVNPPLARLNSRSVGLMTVTTIPR